MITLRERNAVLLVEVSFCLSVCPESVLANDCFPQEKSEKQRIEKTACPHLETAVPSSISVAIGSVGTCSGE